jgi:BirA family transcriptional regulator, biotin operon repressor / biotin---[acetyl-CoA-carboxylase] ligase
VVAIGDGARAQGFGHVHHETVGSTNEEAMRLGGDRVWVTAGEQVAGRGRRGRHWTSPPGNLYASLRLVDPSAPAKAAQLCFVAAVAVGDAVAAVAPRSAEELGLKWPNDVLIGGAKAAGILIEAVHGETGFATVIGCGVNVAHHPGDTPYRATHLALKDPAVDAAGLFAALSDAFALRLAEWQRGAGFAAIRSAWLSRAAGLGDAIEVRLPDVTLKGRFEALTEDGVLLLKDDADIIRPISAGEVFFPETTETA